MRKQLDLTQADVDEARLATSSAAQSQLSKQRGGTFAPAAHGAALGATGHARLANEGPPLIPETPAVQLAQPPQVRPHQQQHGGYAEERDNFIKPPKHDFPRCDGNLPNLWIDRCLSYFELYRVGPQNWVTTASM